MASHWPVDTIQTVPDKMSANWRVAMYSLVNLFVCSHQTLSLNGKGTLSPVALLIYATVSIANVQKLMRERTVPSALAATTILPREWVVPISRSAIASATGLPRETVRRQVAQMIKADLLMEDERGGVTVVPGMIDTLELEPLLNLLLTDFARTAERLLRLGVIEAHGRQGAASAAQES